MDIGLALTYVTRDPDWIKKAGIGGLLLDSPAGRLVDRLRLRRAYCAQRDRRRYRAAIGMGDFGGGLVRGLVALIGVLIWIVPVIAISGCGSALQSAGDTAAVLGFLLSFCQATPLGILISVFIVLTVLGRFAVNDNLGDMLQFGDVIAQTQQLGVGPYPLYFVRYLIACFASTPGLIASIISVIFTIAYACFAISHGVGRLNRGLATGAATTTEQPAV